jgi:predicted metalloprotease
MKWEGREESENVEDRRGMSGKAGIALGGGGIVIVILGLLFGFDPQQILGLLGQQGPGGGPVVQNQPPNPAEEKLKHFSSTIFRDTEIVWDDLFRNAGRQYNKPGLVLYSGHDQSACGLADSAIGPFYCPGDAKVYLDLSFFTDMMARQLHSSGDFARAYVIAHEVGHHVQRLLGYSQRVVDARRTASKTEANRMSVRLELQADYFAGVWAHHAQKKFNFLEKGDIESALNAANQIGDDRLQRNARGTVVPDSFTHGTSKQRMRWFTAGFETGDVNKARALFDMNYDDL